MVNFISPLTLSHLKALLIVLKLYCYYSANVIIFSLAQSDPIKWLLTIFDEVLTTDDVYIVLLPPAIKFGSNLSTSCSQGHAPEDDQHEVQALLQLSQTNPEIAPSFLTLLVFWLQQIPAPLSVHIPLIPSWSSNVHPKHIFDRNKHSAIIDSVKEAVIKLGVSTLFRVAKICQKKQNVVFVRLSYFKALHLDKKTANRISSE